MSIPSVMTGARAKFGIFNPTTGQTQFLGMFMECSWGMRYDIQPIYIMGSYAPVASEPVAQEAINISCSSWRYLDHGPHVDGQVPRLQDLLFLDYIQLVVSDRQRETQGRESRVVRFKDVRCTGYDTSISQRNLSQVSIGFIALTVSDESVDNVEHPTAARPPV